MRFLAALFLRGLAAILPLALTGYLVYAAVVGVEAFLHRLTQWTFDLFGLPWTYAPWMGFSFSIALVMVIGLLTYSFLVRTIYQRITALVNRIPIVKSVYGTLVDVVRLFGGEERPFHKVVLVALDNGLDVLGFVSREDFDDLQGFPAGHLAVYLPMSYQLGGFTVVVDRARVREVPMRVEDALRFCVTAGVARNENELVAAPQRLPREG